MLIVERYRPPYELTSDMLLVVALAPTRNLRCTFAGVPFLSVLGRTPLVVWFSRITQSCYYDAGGEWCCEHGSSSDGIYSELNILGLLRRRALFVPGIYASEARTVHIARHYYGMPKQLAQTIVGTRAKLFEGRLVDHAHASFLRARLLGGGSLLGALVSRLWPRSTWSAQFPSGSSVRALLLAASGVQIAHVQAGQLALEAPWLAEARPFLPIGLYVLGLQMRLPKREQGFLAVTAVAS